MKLEDLKSYEILEDWGIDDIASRAVRLRHKKTGAKIALLSNDDENKVFYIGFRTPPSDSTGVAHITEHSVLCGSKEFPVKDPFVELAKGSLNTFLNAMTYPDKTVYPVASCNDADFQNLMHVYLDAVFYPNTYTNEAIFRQEGWHYEFDEEGKLFINGVVYNEMKGAYSSPEDVLFRQIMNSLYPHNNYGVESGGDPDNIPDLTYEQFLDFHRAYYHPSNSYIYLYGDMDMAEKLDYIDKEYLSKFDYREVNSAIIDEKPFNDRVTVKHKCSLAEGEDAKDNTYLTLNFSYGQSTDRELYMALSVLDSALVSAPGAPLKQALVEKGLGDDVYSVVENGIKQPYFSIVAKGADTNRQQEFVDTCYQVINDIIKKGFDKKSLMAAIVKQEFSFREADFGRFPKGLMYGLQALDSWLYDDEKPFVHIECLDCFAKMKEYVKTDYFEKLLKAIFIDNKHSSCVILEPELGLAEKKADELAEKLSKYQASLSGEEIDKIKSDFEKLRSFQEQVDTPEALATIPLLSREDIKKEAEKFDNKSTEISGVKIVLHNYRTTGISYLSLMFNLKDVPGDLYPYIGLLTYVLGQIDTKKHKYADLNNEMSLVAGGMNFTRELFVKESDRDIYEHYFSVKTKYLYENASKVLDFVKEVIFESNLDDSVRINEILAEIKSQLQSSMISGGHSVAVSRAAASFTKAGRINEIVNGIDFYRFISDLCSNFDSKKSEISSKLKELCKIIFRPENFMVDLTSEEEKGAEGLSVCIGELKKALYTEDVRKESFVPELIKENEGFMTAGQVLYVCRAGDFKKDNLEYNGALSVLKTIMGYNYLWENVRVKGGAYGCMSRFSRNGGCYFVSYRDPNLSKTIKIFEDAAGAMEKFDVDERTMTKYVIGTFSELDTPLTPSGKGMRSLAAYLGELPYDKIQKAREEALNCTAEDIRNTAKYIKSFISSERLVVVGNAAKIKEENNLFDKIENLF
ncbi:MAG: insulinase family protein [Lachnospiraceae bacterium]|nr:insulinase family protein [Lachnospiraceae bacterium]